MSSKINATKKPSPPLPAPEELIALGVTPPTPEAEPERVGIVSAPFPQRPPLLRYPLGKNPLYQGVNHVLR
jgi:hypothetical protein